MKISVVIPAYNRAETIRKCLDTVVNQTLSPLEILVVDDGSTDATVATVSGYQHHRISIRCLPLDRNRGAQAARNHGIREAKGDWIAFQDSDDEWLPEKLEKQVAALESNNCGPLTVVHTDCLRDEHQAGERQLWALPEADGESIFPRLLRSPGPMFQGLLTSRLALEKIGLLDENVPSYQEWDTAIRLAQVCRFLHLREPLFIYHLHAGETISKSGKRDVDGYQFVVDKYRDEILRCCGNKVYNNHLVVNAVKAMEYGLFDAVGEILNRQIGFSALIPQLRLLAKMRINPARLRLWLSQPGTPQTLLRRVMGIGVRS
jgi:glycosyltransferase involved in cell wall biosynthesis